MTLSRDRNAAPARRARGADLVIDGEAVVIDRVARVKSAVERAASAQHVHASHDPETEPEQGRPFGRRVAWQVAPLRKPAEPDLFFQARSMERFAAPAREGDGGVAIFLRDTAGSIPAGGKVAGLGLLVLSLLIPAAFLVSAGAPVATAKAGGAAGFSIEELEAGIVPRGDGEVLEVEGLVRNRSGATAPVPPMRIALADAAGTTTLRPLSTGNRALAAGGTLRFHSAVAVPLGTEGDISVEFVSASGMTGTLEFAEATDTETHILPTRTFDE